MRSSILIYNPIAGRRPQDETVERIQAILKEGDFWVSARATRGPGDATHLARDAVGTGADVVFVLGGDGTQREAAAGLLGSNVALGPLPGGTTNVLARALGLPRDPEEAARALCHLTPRGMDVGMCGELPFLMMASAGLDAEVMSQLSKDLKGLLGNLGVVLQGLGHWLIYAYPQVELTADGKDLRATLAVVSNIPYYGGPFRMAPTARFDDGKLDLVLYHGLGRYNMLTFVIDVITDLHHHRSDVEIFQVSEVMLRGPSSVCLQIDGDGCGQALPVRIGLAPDKLQVLARPAPSL